MTSSVTATPADYDHTIRDRIGIFGSNWRFALERTVALEAKSPNCSLGKTKSFFAQRLLEQRSSCAAPVDPTARRCSRRTSRTWAHSDLRDELNDATHPLLVVVAQLVKRRSNGIDQSMSAQQFRQQRR